MIRVAGLGLLAAFVAGCATVTTAPVPVPLLTADGRQVGTVGVAEDRGGLLIRAEVNGLPAGTRGIHVHAVGRCEGPDFTSAGPHWNPQGRQHGTENPAGPHEGDMPNVVIDAAGRGRVEFRLSGGTLRGQPTSLLDADGASVVLHEKADDYRTDPSGNSGARVACAVLGG